MSPELKTALEEAHLLASERAWVVPGPAAIVEAERLLALTAVVGPAPVVFVEPGGSIVLEWEVPARGWLSLSVNGGGTVEHSAVIDDDEYGRTEPFALALPDWADQLLHRLFGALH